MANLDDGFRRFVDRNPTPRTIYGLMLLFALLLLTDGYNVQSIGYVAPALVKAWGLNKAAMGPVFSMGLIGIMVGAMIMTPVADRLGARRVLLACTAAYSLLTLATAYVHGIQALMIMRLLSGAVLGAVMPNAIALMSDYAPSRLRNTMVTVVMCGFSLGGGLGGVVAALAIQNFGWPAVFFVGAAAPLLLLLPLLILLPESVGRILSGKAGPADLRRFERLVPGYAASPEALAPPAPHAGAAGHGPIRGLFANGMWSATALMWAVFFLNLLMLFTLTSWLPTIITASGLSLQFANLATSGYQFAGIPGAVAIALLCDRWGARRVLPIMFLGAASALFLLGAAGANPLLIATATAAAGVCVVGGQNAVNAFASGFYPSAMRATGVGWALGVGRLGSILGPLVAGELIKVGARPSTLFQLCAIAGLIAAAAMAVVARRQPQ